MQTDATQLTTNLNVAFAGGNGYPPEAQGGVQSSTHDLATRLLAIGGQPSVLAPLYGDGWFGWSARTRLKLGQGNFVRDDRLGYPVYRAWFQDQVVPEFAARVRPDIAVVQCHGTVPIALEFRALGVPLVIYLRNVEFDQLGGDLSGLTDASFIANSAFTASIYRDRFGVDPVVIPPTIDPSVYQTTTTGEFVTFINPVEEKGVARAIEIARACPDIPFLFVESWLLDPDTLNHLQRVLRDHPNVRFERRTPDMTSVYGRTRIVLAPSKWSEAWGRVASEAHCSGIPVIGSNRGGLPESVGEGGITLDYDSPLDVWVTTLRNLWFDREAYAAASDAARTYAQRSELNGDQQFRTFLSVLQHANRSTKAA